MNLDFVLVSETETNHYILKIILRISSKKRYIWYQKLLRFRCNSKMLKLSTVYLVLVQCNNKLHSEQKMQNLCV